MPVKLTQELKDFVSRLEVAKVIATVNEDGSPDIGPKGTTQVYDDESLAYAEFTGKRHYRNVQRDNRIAIACIDWQERKGYRFEGKAEVYESGEVFDQVASKYPPERRPKLVVRLPISEVYALSGTEVGERVL